MAQPLRDLDDLHIVSPISMLGDLIPVMTGVAWRAATWDKNCDDDLDWRRRQLHRCVSRRTEFLPPRRSAVCFDPGK